MNGAVQQDAQIVAINPKLHAYILILTLFKEPRVENVPVPLRQHRQDFADDPSILFLLHQIFQVQLLIGNICRIQGIVLIATIVTAALRKHVLAN